MAPNFTFNNNIFSCFLFWRRILASKVVTMVYHPNHPKKITHLYSMLLFLENIIPGCNCKRAVRQMNINNTTKNLIKSTLCLKTYGAATNCKGSRVALDCWHPQHLISPPSSSACPSSFLPPSAVYMSSLKSFPCVYAQVYASIYIHIQIQIQIYIYIYIYI